MVKLPKFKAGDVLFCTYWDQGDNEWREGMTLIEEYGKPSEYNSDGCYKLKRLGGDFTYVMMSCLNLENHAYPRYIGNIYEDKALRILYGT